MKKKTKPPTYVIESYTPSPCPQEPEVLAGFFALFYLLPSLIAFLIGLNSIGDSCAEPLNRIEYIYPAFQLGCYLGEPPNE